MNQKVPPLNFSILSAEHSLDFPLLLALSLSCLYRPLNALLADLIILYLGRSCLLTLSNLAFLHSILFYTSMLD